MIWGHSRTNRVSQCRARTLGSPATSRADSLGDQLGNQLPGHFRGERGDPGIRPAERQSGERAERYAEHVAADIVPGSHMTVRAPSIPHPAREHASSAQAPGSHRDIARSKITHAPAARPQPYSRLPERAQERRDPGGIAAPIEDRAVTRRRRAERHATQYSPVEACQRRHRPTPGYDRVITVPRTCCERRYEARARTK